MPVEKLLFVPQIQNERCVKNSNAAERENGGERHGLERRGEKEKRDRKEKSRRGSYPRGHRNAGGLHCNRGIFIFRTSPGEMNCR